LRDCTAAVLTEVCGDVWVEPPLQPLTGEILRFATANREDEARMDVAATGFWECKHQRAFFDVKVFNANASSYCGTQVSTLYRNVNVRSRGRVSRKVLSFVVSGDFYTD